MVIRALAHELLPAIMPSQKGLHQAILNKPDTIEMLGKIIKKPA
jgi:hypothetical protein